MPDSHFTIDPIGYISGCYPDKFGVPRQPGLAPTATADIELTETYAFLDAVRGLSAYSHLWLTFVFHLSPTEWKPLVRPPRLGGNKKIGVFASRSTHRPNRLGQSLVELVDVITDHGVRIRIRGHDLVDGTPIIDIKPYLPWVESIPHARAGFAPEPPAQLDVIFSDHAETQLAGQENSDMLRQLIIEVLAQDPRPAYHAEESDRIYGIRLRNLNVRFHLVRSETSYLIKVVELNTL